MANWTVTTIVLLSVTLSLVASMEVGVSKEECPPGNPLCNTWQPCNYNGSVVVTCHDCKTRLICTPLGGFMARCWVWGHQNCLDGNCVTNPSDECADQ